MCEYIWVCKIMLVPHWDPNTSGHWRCVLRQREKATTENWPLVIRLLKVKTLQCVMSSPCICSVSLLTCLDQSQRGSLFTLFLYSPLLAFFSVCGLNSVRRGLWERAQEYLRKVYRDIGQMITRSRTIGIFKKTIFKLENLHLIYECNVHKSSFCMHLHFWHFKKKNTNDVSKNQNCLNARGDGFTGSQFISYTFSVSLIFV